MMIQAMMVTAKKMSCRHSMAERNETSDGFFDGFLFRKTALNGLKSM